MVLEQDLKDSIRRTEEIILQGGVTGDGPKKLVLSEVAELEIDLGFRVMTKKAEWEMGEGSMVPDRHGLCLLAGLGLVSKEMERDMPGIIRAWMRVEYPNLKDYRENPDFQNAGGLCCDMRSDHVKASAGRFFPLIIGAVEAGSDFSRQFLIYLFRTYRKKEFKSLKKFRTLHASEIEAFARDLHLGANDPASYFFAKARILYMAECMRIEISPDCINDYFALAVFTGIMESGMLAEEEDGRALLEKVTEEILVEADEKVRELFGPGGSGGEAYQRGQDFVNFCLRMDGKVPDFNLLLMERREADMEGEIRKAAARLLAANPEEKLSDYSPRELELYGLLLNLTEALCRKTDDAKSWAERLLFDKGGIYEEWGGRSLFDEEEAERILQKMKPSQDKGAREKEPEKSARKAAPMSQRETDLQALREEVEKEREEIVRLRASLRAVQEKADRFHDLYKNKEQENRSLKAEVRSLLQDKEELNVLRSHVYRESLKDGELIEETGQAREEEIRRMIEALKSRRAAIVGGNPHWTRKLKGLFPSWLFISPSVTGTVKTSVLEGVDRVFFYTDTLCHSTYFRFIRQARESHIPFSYLSGVNIERNVLDLYREMAA